MKKALIGLLALFFLTCNTLAQNDAGAQVNYGTSFTISSPYAGVDWQKFGQYKAALHSHTERSDGDKTVAEMVEEHYAQEYDILGISDHDVLNSDWTSGSGALTPQRYNEIISGTGRNGRGLLRLPYTIERAEHNEETNTFFADFSNDGEAELEELLSRTAELGGIAVLNHPGRYTGGSSSGTKGPRASNNPDNIKKYVDLFMNYKAAVGMEIINKKDQDSASDRILWDNVLKQTMPRGRFVWGFSNDDSHSTSRVGFSFNVFLMPENTLDNFRAAMKSGSFYAVAKISKIELGDNFTGSGPVPVIKNIEVNEADASITISAENTDRIEWISEGVKFAEGNTVKLNEYSAKIGSYIRANLIGKGGIAFTQPFGVR